MKHFFLTVLSFLFLCVSCSHKQDILIVPEDIPRLEEIPENAFKEAEIPKVTIITYHRISRAVTNDMTITPALFRRHMLFLAKNHYSAITMDQWCSAVLDGKPLPEKPIIITFDDAWRSQYENALPILNEFGFKATFYAYTDVIGNKSTMTYKQLRSLIKQGHNVGCHSAAHSNLAKPTPAENEKMYRRRLIRETLKAKKTLEEHLGKRVIHFCYPYGCYDTEVITQLKKSGFVSAVTVNPSPNTIDTPLFKLGRFIIGPWVKEKGLKYKLDMLPLDYRSSYPFDGEIRTRPTESVSIILPHYKNIHYVKFQMKWKWRNTDFFWDKETRTLAHVFNTPIKAGVYTVQAHAWDANSNHYVYAWLFRQK